MNAQDLKHDAAKAVDDAGEAIKSAKDSGMDALHDATSTVQEAVSNAAAAVRDEVKQRVKDGKDVIADQSKRLADNLHSAVSDFEDGSLQDRVMDSISNGVSNISEGLRGISLGNLYQEAEAMARRNPAAFVAGAALAGFAVGRFALASSKAVAPEPRGQVARPRSARTHAVADKAEPKL
ncbi:MAG: hypothetical protein ABIV25_12990 [Paracoccaceae bacterium]